MLTPDQTGGFPPLDIYRVTRVLAGVNTELKSLALATLSDGMSDPLDEQIPMHEDEVYSALAIEAGGNSPARKLTRSAIGELLVNMPNGLVEVDRVEDGRLFARTQSGGLATAVGGHLLTLSIDSGVPTRTLVGEHLPSRKVSKVDNTVDSLEGRLIVLSGLSNSAAHEWRSTTELIREFETYGLSRPAAYSHLKTLWLKGIIECEERDSTKKGAFRPKDYRLKQKNGAFPPTDLVQKYLEIVSRFAILDPVFVAEGLQMSEDISHNRNQVPALVERSYSSSGHTGKTFKRVKGRKS